MIYIYIYKYVCIYKQVNAVYFNSTFAFFSATESLAVLMKIFYERERWNNEKII